MKVAIFCGQAITSQYKAKHYASAILNAGHDPLIYCRGKFHEESLEIQEFDNVFDMVNAAVSDEVGYAFPCNDWLFIHTNAVNQLIGNKFYQYDLSGKDHIYKLVAETKLSSISTWHALDEVPDGVPLFIKPLHGSGTTGGHQWAYKKYKSKAEFEWFLVSTNQLNQFMYYQGHPGVIGPYVFQEYIDTSDVIYHHYMNDGQTKAWMQGTMRMNANHTCTYMRCKVIEDDTFGLLSKLDAPILGAIQASNVGDQIKVFDFNVRPSGVWNYIHAYMCPTFFDTYFNNVLNDCQDSYDWKFTEFEYALTRDEVELGNVIELEMEDYPQANMIGKIYLGMQ